MTKMRILGSAAVVAAVVGAAACDERLADLTGPTPNLSTTFSSIQRDIFEAGDASGRPDCTSCHNAQLARFNGGLDLSHAAAYASLVNAASVTKPGAVRVIPGDAENSYLVHKLEGRPGIVGQRMPVSGPFLSQGQIDVIRRWIELGAAND